MVQFPKHFTQDLTEDLKVRYCGTICFNTDNLSNVISVDLYNGEAPATPTGTVVGAVICPDGSTVPIDNGTISGNTVSITLTAACFAITGQIGVGIQIVDGDAKTTIFKARYNVERFETDNVIDPDSRITLSVSDLIDDIAAAVATIPADYSDLLAAVAPTFNTSTAYAAGAYVWYDGNLYRFTTAHTAGNWVGTDAETVSISDEIKRVEAAAGDAVAAAEAKLHTLLPTDLADGTTYTAGKCVRYDNGDLRNNSSCKVTGFIDISGLTSVVYDRLLFAASSTYAGIAFYTSEQAYISGVQAKISQAADGTEISTETVPANTKYIRLSVLNDGTAQLYDAADYAAKVYPRLDKAESDIAEGKKFDARVTDTLDDGYYRIPIDRWALNGWNGYNSKDSRAYRVRCLDVLTFDVDTYIMADEGYTVGGWDSAGNAIGGTATKVPANTSVVIYSRRFTEDTSEVISDIAPFVNAIKIASVLAPIVQLKPTFTDVSMFERVGVGGDSYAAGGGIISGVTALTWGKNLSRQAGIDVDIYAKSGQNVVEWVADASHGLPALLAGEECGLYWLQHGINGTSTAEELGTADDMSASPHPATFYGQYVEAIEQIKEAFPNARIVLATVIGTSYGLYQTQYANVNTAIKAIAQYCEVPCVDVADDEFYRSRWYQDNSASNHPTAMTAAGMAAANRRLISKCIQDNPTYFINYGSN